MHGPHFGGVTMPTRIPTVPLNRWNAQVNIGRGWNRKLSAMSCRTTYSSAPTTQVAANGPQYCCTCVPIQYSGDPTALGKIHLCRHYGHAMDGPLEGGIPTFRCCTFAVPDETITTCDSIQLDAGYDACHGGTPPPRKDQRYGDIVPLPIE